MRLRLIATCALLVAVSGCGGGGGKKDATDLLDRAFAHPIHSARLDVDGQLAVSGISALKRPVRIEAAGPVASAGRGGRPRYDVDLKIGVGVNQTVDTGSLSTGDRSFVKFEDSWYELSPAQVRASRRSAGGARCGGRGIGTGARRWVRDARNAGTETVNGVETTHVTGSLDVRRTVQGLSGYLRRCGAVVGAGTQVSRSLSRTDLNRLAGLVENPGFDVYVGKKDGLIHRVAIRMTVKVPEAQRQRAGGLSSANLQLSVNLSSINRTLTVEAPSDSRPVSELTARLGGAEALTNSIKGLGQDGPGGSALSGGQSTTTTPQSGGGAPSPDAFKSYSRCLDKADPENRVALQRCARLLKGSK